MQVLAAMAGAVPLKRRLGERPVKSVRPSPFCAVRHQPPTSAESTCRWTAAAPVPSEVLVIGFGIHGPTLKTLHALRGVALDTACLAIFAPHVNRYVILSHHGAPPRPGVYGRGPTPQSQRARVPYRLLKRSQRPSFLSSKRIPHYHGHALLRAHDRARARHSLPRPVDR